MPLQSSGIIVVDKTSVITTASTQSSVSAVQAAISGRSNGVGGGGPGGGGGGGLQNHTINEWTAENDTIHTVNANNAANNNHNLIRRNQRTIPGSSMQNTKTTITTIPLANHSFNSNQMNQINQQQHQLHHHHQQQQSRQLLQQQHHQTVLQSTQPNQVIVSEEFLEHANFGNNPNAAGSANVINLTANDLVNQTQIIKLVSDGNGGNMLIDSLGNVTNGGHLHANSKLLVGNLTVLSKQANTGGGQQTINFLNTKGLSYLTTKNQTQSQGGIQKIVSLPLKSNNLVKASPTSQQQIHHHIAGGNVQNGNATMVQKMSVPRSVQVVTRVQTLAPSSPQQQQQQQSAQHQLQHSVHNNQVIMQQKYVHNIVSAANVNTKMNSNVGTVKKQNMNQSPKVTPQKIIGQTVGSALKTFAQQQPQQQLQQQHQQFQTVGIAPTTHSTIKSLKSQKVVRKIIGNAGNNTTVNAKTKYIMQNPLVLSNTTGNQLLNTKLSNNNNTGNIVVPQRIINTINNSSCPPSSGGAIKFVNAHGTVLQSQQNQHTIQTVQQQHQQQPNQKIRNQLNKNQQNNQNQQPLQQQQHQHFNESTAAVMTTEGIFIPAYVNSTQAAANAEEIMINGTQMTEEMSARILQSLSQKSLYSNMRQYQQMQHTSQQQQQIQQQQKIIQQHQQSAQSTNVVFEPTTREYSICKPTVVHQQQQQHQQQLHQQQQQPKIISSNVVFEPATREYGICKPTVLQHQQQQQQQQHQQQKIIQQHQQSTNIVFEPATRVYPVCKPATIHQQQQQQYLQQQHQLQQQQHQLQQQQQSHVSHMQFNGKYVTGRTQSLDRKQGNQTSKRSTNFFKVKYAPHSSIFAAKL